jgi:hypothetical protein
LTKNQNAEQTYVVFQTESGPMGVSAADIWYILPAAASVGSAEGVLADDVPAAEEARLVVLTDRGGEESAPLIVRGVLSMITVDPSQVAPLPPLCISPGGSSVGVALAEDRVLFLIVDPYRLSEARAALSPMAHSKESA